VRERRALVAYRDKDVFERARSAFAADVEFIDVRAGRDAGPSPGPAVPAFGTGPETLRVVDAVMADTPFAHVVSTSESNLAFAAFLRDRYGLAGLTFGQALTVTNKWRMKQAFRGALPSAECWLSGDFVERVGRRAVPEQVVVKPLSGSSRMGVRRLPATEAAAYLRSRGELMVVEEALDLDGELHCDGLVSDGRLTALIPSAYDRPALRPSGLNLASIHLPPTDDRWRLATGAAQAVTRLIDTRDFVFHLELLQCGGELYFGEIGLRPPGGGRAESLRRFFGFDCWQAHVGLQLGRLAEHPPPRVRDDYCGVVGVAADPEREGEPGRFSPDDLLAVPGVVNVTPGSSRAYAQARLGSSAAYTHLVFFQGADMADAARSLAGIAELTRG